MRLIYNTNTKVEPKPTTHTHKFVLRNPVPKPTTNTEQKRNKNEKHLVTFVNKMSYFYCTLNNRLFDTGNFKHIS